MKDGALLLLFRLSIVFIFVTVP